MRRPLVSGLHEVGTDRTVKALRPRDLFCILIGIDAYATNPFCESLFGAVADAKAMETFLLARGVPTHNLIRLTASQSPDGAFREPPAALPSYEVIVEAIRSLGQRAASVRGQLLVHFSGHGCQTPTLLPAIKAEEGFDQGLVPFDIGRPGARVLRDIEISYLLDEIGERGVATAVVLDACHSGGMLRDESLALARGARLIGLDRDAKSSLVASVSALERSWRRRHGVAYSPLAVSSPFRGVVPMASPSVREASLIAACLDGEAAYEFPFDGEIRGVLTYSLLECLARSDLPLLSWVQLQRLVMQGIRRVGIRQTPVFEGQPSETLLGLVQAGSETVLRVIDVDQSRCQILLDSGQAAGLSQGARLAVIPGDLQSASLQIEAEVVESGHRSAWARVRSSELVRIAAGDAALLVMLGERKRCRVHLAPGPEPEMSQGAKGRSKPSLRGHVLRDGSLAGHEAGDWRYWLQTVEQALVTHGAGFLERWEGDQDQAAEAPPDLRVVLGRFGSILVLAPDGQPILEIPKLAEAPGSARLLVDRLVHLARFCQIRDLENLDLRSPLRGRLTLRAGRLPPGFRLGDELCPDPCFEAIPRFAVGDPLCLSLGNRSPRSLHLYVLSLRSDWGVSLLYPRSGVEALPSGQEIHLPFRLTVEPASNKVQEVFKVIATARPINLRWLELPSMGEPLLLDWNLRSLPPDPVGSSIASTLSGKPMFREAEASACRLWTTDQVTVEVAHLRG